MVWVVLTGTPSDVAISTVIPPAVSAQNPPNGLSFVIRDPIVFTIRHPPIAVPKRGDRAEHVEELLVARKGPHLSRPDNGIGRSGR